MVERRALISSLALAAVAASAPVLAATAADAGPTYNRDVAPILAESCVSCHRANQIGPMSLLTYDEVRPWAKSIAKNVQDGTMPPWHADPSFGHFANDRRLEAKEIDAVVRWVQAGAPEGDPADRPAKPEFPDDEWILGEPDLVVSLEEVAVPAGKTDLFPKLIGRVMLPEDRWIQAVEFRAGNRKVLHHIIAFQVKGFGEPDLQGGWLGAWAAGTDPMVFPRGHRPAAPEGRQHPRRHALPPDRDRRKGHHPHRHPLRRRHAEQGAGQHLGAERRVRDSRRRAQPRGGLQLQDLAEREDHGPHPAHALPRQGLQDHRLLPRRPSGGPAQRAALGLQLADQLRSWRSRSRCPPARASSASPTTTTRRTTRSIPTPLATCRSGSSPTTR